MTYLHIGCEHAFHLHLYLRVERSELFGPSLGKLLFHVIRNPPGSKTLHLFCHCPRPGRRNIKGCRTGQCAVQTRNGALDIRIEVGKQCFAVMLISLGLPSCSPYSLVIVERHPHATVETIHLCVDGSWKEKEQEQAYLPLTYF